MKRVQSISVFALVIVLASIISPAVSLAEEISSGDEKYVADVVVGGEYYGLYKMGISFSEALDLAYTIRNLTYELLQWEMSKGIQAANVSLIRGDVFLAKALELSQNNTERATVFAIVAAIHYSHAPAFANPVLAKVIPPTLDENGNITVATVEAVLGVAGELKQLLLAEIEEVENWNLTLPALVSFHIERGDNLTNKAQELIETDITEAFRHAVAGYRAYVRAYAVLVKGVFAQKVRLATADGEDITPRLIAPRSLRLQLDIATQRLPAEIRERVRAKIEAGEIRNFRELAQYLREEAIQLRMRYRKAQVDAVARILTDFAIKLELRHPIVMRAWRNANNITNITQLYQYCYQLVERISNETNTTGIQLLYMSLYQFQLQLSLNIREMFENELVRVKMGY
ncbi:MAG: hypothetical protein QXL31_02205 [Thermosphaera sp.]